MADETTQGVHPFTVGWWRRLPDAYRRADRVQGHRLGDAWHGINRDPRFVTGWDGWYRSNLSTKAWESSVGLTRTFRGTPNVPIHIQSWHHPTEVAEDGDSTAELGEAQLGVMILGDQGDETRVRHIVRNYTGNVISDTEVSLATDARGTHSTTITPDRFGTFQVTVQVTIAVPNARDLIEAIHVGTQAVTFDDLPGEEHFSLAAAYPLLRYLEGIGYQAGYLSDMVDSMHDGSYTNPATAPETSLLFLAAILGLPTRYSKSLSGPQLRSHLVSLVEGRRPTPGSVDHIARTAQQWLTGTRQVSVRAAHTIPGYDGPDPLHTLVVYARADEVPNNDLAAFAAFLNASGVIPAGHRVVTLEASQSWTAWENAYGTTWAAKDANITTWNQADAAGVVLDFTEGA